MRDIQLGEIETRFAKEIWNRAPIASGELVKVAAERFLWKKSTTYTVLKKLCQKGLFENQGGIVTVRITEEEYRSIRCERMVETEYQGSLPSFIAAFTSRKELSDEEIREIKRIIDQKRIK